MGVWLGISNNYPCVDRISQKLLHMQGRFCHHRNMRIVIDYTRHQEKVGIPASISVAVAIGLSVMFKHIFSRPRPSVLRLIEETGFSFPSAHTLCSAQLYILC